MTEMQTSLLFFPFYIVLIILLATAKSVLGWEISRILLLTRLK